MESKIKSIEVKDPVTFGDGNRMEKLFIDLENGDSGEVLSKTADYYKVGDEVEYEKVSDKWGTKLKPFKKKGFKKFTPKDEGAAARAQAPSQALQCAIQSIQISGQEVKSVTILALAEKYNEWIVNQINLNK